MATIIVEGVEYFVRWDGVQRDQDGNPDHEPPPERPRAVRETTYDPAERPTHYRLRKAAIQDTCLKVLGDEEMAASDCARRSHGAVSVDQALNAFQHLVAKHLVIITGIRPGQGGARLYRRNTQ